LDSFTDESIPTGEINMNKDREPIRVDEMGIEVCVLCDCAVENNTCLCDMRGW
jgi:hypothetical protein